MTDRASRALALDLGTVRIGLALSDPSRRVALPAGKMDRRAVRETLAPLLTLIRENGVDAVVVGYPLLMSGEIGVRAKDAETFAARLRDLVACPVVLWDERLTSVQANRALLEGDVRRRQPR